MTRSHHHAPRGRASARSPRRLAPLVTGLALAILLGAAGSASARTPGASVQMEVDRRTLTTDDELELRVTFEGDLDRYEEPGLGDFAVVGRSSQQLMSIVNGRVSRQQVQVYTLRPSRAGTLTIAGAKAYRDGQVVAQGAPLQVTVKAPAAPPPVAPGAARSLDRRADEQLFLHVGLPRDTFYVGEPFVLSWDLFFRRELHVEAAEIVTRPTLDGLLVEELLSPDARASVRERRVGGQAFRFIPRSVQLATALRPGKVTVDAMAMRVSAGDVWRQRRYTLRSQPLELTVEEVPAAGRPKWYQDGNLGRFAMTAELHDDAGRAPSRLKTGQRLVLTVTVSGRGNLVSLKPPVLEGGDTFDIQPLPTSADDVVDKDASGMHGRRVFQFLLAPLAPGKVQAPTVHLAWFDPEAEEFETVSLPGLSLEVEGPHLAGRGATQPEGPETLDIRPLLEADALDTVPHRPLTGTTLFWLLLALPPALFGLVELRFRLRRRRDRNPQARLSRAAGANARKRLKAAEQAQRDDLVKDCFGQIARTFVSYFEERANLPATGMTHDELREAAGQAGYPRELLDAVVVELENCDFARFAPAAVVGQQMRESLSRAEELVRRLEAVEPRRRP